MARLEGVEKVRGGIVRIDKESGESGKSEIMVGKKNYESGGKLWEGIFE